MLNRIRQEPALVSGAVQAVLALLIAFGLDLSNEQTASILAVTAAVLAIVVRSRVTPTAGGPEPGEDGAVTLETVLLVVVAVCLILLVCGVTIQLR